jgi:hypothetical protein
MKLLNYHILVVRDEQPICGKKIIENNLQEL